MLFNSYAFLFLFLPVVLCGYFLIGRRHQLAAALFLALASLFFYGWWNPVYVPLLLVSISVNYAVARVTGPAVARGAMTTAKVTTTIGIAFNLALLAFYKYANFFVDNLDAVAGVGWVIPRIVLPLGISFFTFTQIAFLVDTYKGIAREYNPVHYALFVTYFPHLIAGPILHHKEVMPQFAIASNYRPSAENFAVGFTLFSIGLVKKCVLADGIAPFANDVFAAAAGGEAPTLFDAWGGSLAYTLQLYFDFSGYSDMAIGLSRLFGIVLPLNFNSPYKSDSIAEFWRRWHMTLSRFLRDYLYVPLGGNRRGGLRRYVNLLIVMVLGGLWHGAAWTFVLWGALHGFYLVINHAWRAICAHSGFHLSGRLSHVAAVTLTFLAVVFAWVFFRAGNIETALLVVRGMIGMNGVAIPAAFKPILGPLASLLESWGVLFPLGHGAQFLKRFAWIAALLPIVFLLPNSQQILGRYRPGLNYPAQGRAWIEWRFTAGWAIAGAALAALGILSLSRVSEFLYFQF